MTSIIVVKKFHKKIFIFTIKIIDYFILFFVFTSLFSLLIPGKIILDRESCSMVYINFKFLFTENSHFSFVLPSILFYTLWRVTNVFNFFKFFILLSTFFLSILYLSLSMIIGVLIANIVIFLSSYRVLNVKYKIFSLLITFTFIMLLINKPVCQKRILDLLEGVNINQIYKLKSSHHKQENFINDFSEGNINFSSKIYLDSFNTSLTSILNYPFGSGLNNFQLLSDKYMLRVNDRDINAHSGRSILFKIITEFGIFSLIFFIMLIIMTFSARIIYTKKIFFLPIIFIQLVNGEGYFNGFFLISLFILYFSYGDKKFFSWR